MLLSLLDGFDFLVFAWRWVFFLSLHQVRVLAAARVLQLLALFTHFRVHLGTSAVGVKADESWLLGTSDWSDVVDRPWGLLSAELSLVQHH